ncbi:unnamed protein product [Linum trigynum]|uniref:Transposase n=1 Tax=Linum trigynum TaxID=586398 RepID=A0AAV2EMS2_9ROSI
MLVAAILYQNVFIRLKQRNSHYTCLPTSDHWAFASIVCGKLEIFSEISNLFSGTKYPTANLFFPKICDLKLKLCEWLVDDNDMISKMAELMWDKFLKYWGDIHEILVVAVVLDPRYKLHIVDYYARKFDKGQCVLDVDKVRAVLSDLIMEYQAKQNKNVMVASGGSSDHSLGSSSSVDLDFQLFVQQRKKSRGTLTQTDLDNYLNEEVLPWTTDFDILLWWKMNGAKYPILQDIARDMLVVPVTSVASESAFSNGGRVLNPNRCKLGYTTMEALMCTKSWLQNSISIEICALLDDEDHEDDIDGYIVAGIFWNQLESVWNFVGIYWRVAVGLLLLKIFFSAGILMLEFGGVCWNVAGVRWNFSGILLLNYFCWKTG